MRTSTGLDLDVTALTDGEGSVRLEISGVGRGTLMRSLEQGALSHGDYGATGATVAHAPCSLPCCVPYIGGPDADPA